MRVLTRTLLALLALSAAVSFCQEPAEKSGSSAAPKGQGDVMRRVIDGVKQAERALYLYERVERVESRKEAADPAPESVRVSRVVPAGTAIAKISLGPDGKPRPP